MKGFLAVLATERLYAKMLVHVRLKVIQSVKLFVAFRALVLVLVLEVNNNVGSQVRCVYSFIIAVITIVDGFPVRRFVSVEVTKIKKFFATFLAFVAFLVDFKMLQERTTQIVSPVAQIALIFPFFSGHTKLWLIRTVAFFNFFHFNLNDAGRFYNAKCLSCSVRRLLFSFNAG